MADALCPFEDHPKRRALRSYGKLAVIEDPTDACFLAAFST